MKLQFGNGSGSRKQKIGLLMLSLFSAGATHGTARSPSPPKTPKEVLEAYRKMDDAGERLTVGGWYQASKFFVKPAPPPRQRFMVVNYGPGTIERSPRFEGSNNRIKILVDCDGLGQIDSSGRFTSVVVPSLTDDLGRPVRKLASPFLNGPVRQFLQYVLVLADTHWEFGPNREGPRQVKGTPEWRIETFEIEPRVTAEAAIRYLKKLHDESSSEIIKKNTEKSIVTIRYLRYHNFPAMP